MTADAGGERVAPRPTPTDVRLARAHLRVGLYALARMELETMVTAGGVEGETMADLAQARWRTGDLAGAGLAAQTYLEAGGDDPSARVIAAEAAMADGRVADARRLADEARQRDGNLEAIFAGQHRSRVWRVPGSVEAGTAGEAGSETAGESEPEAAAGPATSESVPGSGDLEPAPATVSPYELISFAATTLRDDQGRAAVELALVLRSEPSLAPAVLELLATSEERPPSRSAAALEVVRGDAYRLIGRPREADQAYARAVTVLNELGGTPG